MALAHRLLVVIYHVLATRKPYQELRADYFEQRDRARLIQRWKRWLSRVGRVM